MNGVEDESDPFSGRPLIAGGETSDFGDGDAPVCVTTRETTIDAERARELGFAVDAQLASLAREERVPLHFGYCPAEAPSADTLVSLRFEVEEIILFEQVPFMPNPEGIGCQSHLGYRSLVELRTDDGALLGRFYVLLAGGGGLRPDSEPIVVPRELCAHGALPDLRNFLGSLQVSIELERPHWSMMDVTLCASETGTWGQMLAHIEYTDGAAPQFQRTSVAQWPAVEGSTSCTDLPEETPSPVALDDYRGSVSPPSVGIEVRADAVEPQVDVDVEVRINGAVMTDETLAAGSLIDLGRWEPGTLVEADVHNRNGAGQVRAHIIGDGRFTASENCNAADCVASARYTVAYPGSLRE